MAGFLTVKDYFRMLSFERPRALKSTVTIFVNYSEMRGSPCCPRAQIISSQFLSPSKTNSIPIFSCFLAMNPSEVFFQL